MRHPGHAAGPRIRERIEEGFGWIKTTGGPAETAKPATHGEFFGSLAAATRPLRRAPALSGCRESPGR